MKGKSWKFWGVFSPKEPMDIPVFFHSIRFRLALWFSLVLAVVLVVFGSIIYIREQQAIRSDVGMRLSARMRQFEDTVLRPLRYQHDDAEEKPQLSVTMFGLQEGEAAILADPLGRVKQTGGQISISQAEYAAGLGAAGLSSTAWSSGIERERLYGCEIQTEEDDPPNDYIFAIFPLPDELSAPGDLFILGRPVDPDGRMPRLLVTLLLGGAATLLVAASGGTWLAGHALKPVQTITRTAQAISENDLHQRLNLTSRDELGELAHTFDGMLDRLQAAFDRQRRFTADASHELRTPLSILSLESERALEGKRSTEDYRRTLKTIRSESSFMAHLVEEMLALARMDSGQARLKREMLDLSDVAVDAVERFLPLAARREIALQTGDLPELTVTGDRAALGQMIGNLIDNALKYTPTGPGQWVRLETGECSENGRSFAWLRVRDSGPGIPSAALPRLFERFYRADEARSRNPAEEDEIPGSGLGLSIVQRIADLHGGSASAQNLAEGGAVFEIRLPLMQQG